MHEINHSTMKIKLTFYQISQLCVINSYILNTWAVCNETLNNDPRLVRLKGLG